LQSAIGDSVELRPANIDQQDENYR
jgi:hypothetical protein